MTVTEALAEEDENKDFNNDNGGFGRVYMTRPRDQRQRQRRQRIDGSPNGLVTTT